VIERKEIKKNYKLGKKVAAAGEKKKNGIIPARFISGDSARVAAWERQG